MKSKSFFKPLAYTLLAGSISMGLAGCAGLSSSNHALLWPAQPASPIEMVPAKSV